MAAPSGEHVVRGGKEGGLNQYNYSAVSDGSVAGWDSVDQNAGEVGMTGEGGDHFSAAQSHGNAGNSQPGSQT